VAEDWIERSSSVNLRCLILNCKAEVFLGTKAIIEDYILETRKRPHKRPFMPGTQRYIMTAISMISSVCLNSTLWLTT
jgi:hypothetical protein